MSESRGTTQPTGPGIFSAADLKRRMAEREAAKTAEEARHGACQPCRRERTERSPGLPLSERVVQRWRPKDQQRGARLARQPGGPAQVRLRILARPPEAARLWSEG